MTDSDIRTLKGIINALADMRRSSNSGVTTEQADNLAAVGEKAATEAALCILSVAVLTAGQGKALSYLGGFCVKLAQIMAECHPSNPTTVQILQAITKAAAQELEYAPAVTGRKPKGEN